MTPRQELAADTTARVLRQLATVQAADTEGDPPQDQVMVTWLFGDPLRVRALVSVAVSLANQAGYTPDTLRGWALISEPRRKRGWRP